MKPSHEAGMNLSYHWVAGNSVNYTLKYGLYLGYWQMSFAKGWNRFGNKEQSLDSFSKGFSLSPQIGLMIGTPTLRLAFNAAYRFIDLKNDNDVLGRKTTQGWELGTAIVVGFFGETAR